MSPTPGHRRNRVLLTVAALAIAAAAGFGAQRLLAPPAAMMVRNPGVPSAPPASPTRKTRAMDSLPDIAFADRDGRLRHFSHWRGRPLLVNFWAPWCGPCREETPLLEQLSRAPAGFQVIGVAVAGRPEVLHYAEQAGIRYPLLIGVHPGLEAIHALGMEAVFPFSVFVDAAGRIVTLKLGVLSAPEAKLILSRIEALDRGDIDLALARSEIAAGIEKLAAERAKTAGAG